MRFAALFIWLAFPASVYFAYLIYGLPHMIWTYSFHDNGDPHNPLAKREYIDCTFWGPYGLFTVAAEGGRCGWIQFFPPVSDQLIDPRYCALGGWITRSLSPNFMRNSIMAIVFRVPRIGPCCIFPLAISPSQCSRSSTPNR